MNLIPDEKMALSDSRMERARQFLDDARANLAETGTRAPADRGPVAGCGFEIREFTSLIQILRVLRASVAWSFFTIASFRNAVPGG